MEITGGNRVFIGLSFVARSSVGCPGSIRVEASSLHGSQVTNGNMMAWLQ